MITIELGNLGSRKRAERVAELLEGKTYYNFNVTYGSCAGNYPTQVSTKYPEATEEEVTKMLLFVLACSL